MYTTAQFATSMRAQSLVEELAKAGIFASINQPKWNNKRLPPPRIEVQVADEDSEAAKAVFDSFRKAK